jgi:RNA polymerase sigma-70 factor (ECF subfamily)
MVMHTQTVTKVDFSRAIHANGDSKAPAGLDRAADGWDASDEALIERIAHGDRAAMQALYGRHSVRIYRFILRFTVDASTAEDLVSDVFIEVWRSAARFEKKSRASTWLLAIARHKALSARRRRPHEPLDTAAAIEDPADDPETATQNAHRSTLIRKCLSQLSQAHREVIDLVYYHDKSVDEVAQIVGVSPNTVKTRMFYARNRMTGLLKEAGVDGV